MKTLSSEGCRDGVSSEGLMLSIEGLTQSIDGRVLCRLMGREKLKAGRGRPFNE